MTDEHIENEWYVVRHSGEIPEIALHSSLYYLCRDPEGPNLTLSAGQRRRLIEAAGERFREIVLRDLEPENRLRPVYRGVRRSIANYHRYHRFLERQELEDSEFSREVACGLLFFLAAEQVLVEKGRGKSVINCSFVELSRYAAELGLVRETLPDSLMSLCSPEE